MSDNAIVDQIEEVLKKIAIIKPRLEKTAKDYDAKIYKLQEKKVKAMKDDIAILFLVENQLNDLAKGYDFPDDKKTLFFEQGEVSTKAQPDALEIDDVKKTEKLVVKKKLTKCYKEEVKLVRTAIRVLKATQLKSIGAKLVPVDEKIYYKLAGVRTSTGLYFPEVDMSPVKK